MLYSVTGGVDGAFPTGGVIRDMAGNLYGTTESVLKLDTAAKSNRGVVFMLNTTGVETVLHSFVEAAASTAKALCSSLHRDYLA